MLCIIIFQKLVTILRYAPGIQLINDLFPLLIENANYHKASKVDQIMQLYGLISIQIPYNYYLLLVSVSTSTSSMQL